MKILSQMKILVHKDINLEELEALKYLYIADHLLNVLNKAQIECNCRKKIGFFYFLENQKCRDCKKKENSNFNKTN